MLPHEEATIRAFVIAERQPRWLTMMANAKKRSQFLDRLNHCRDLDERFVVPVGSQQSAIVELQQRRAPDRCHLISDSKKLDQQEMKLTDALDAIEESGWGTLVCCIPGRLAYFYDEGGMRRWLLVRSELNS
jgi:hypothetical protein